jgi:hypothetical protein
MYYSDLNLKLNTDTKVISIQPGVDIEVLQYLPIAEKNNIIQLALKNSEDNGSYNLCLLDMWFKMYIVSAYTNITFSEEQKSNIEIVYDELNSNGVLEAILQSLNVEEYGWLTKQLNDALEIGLKYKSTIASVLHDFIQNLPKNAEQAKDLINGFNPEQFTNAMNFFKAINGNQPIN